MKAKYKESMILKFQLECKAGPKDCLTDMESSVRQVFDSMRKEAV